MANGNTGKEKPIKRRLSLNDSGAVRTSLCKLIRQRYNNSIDTALFRDLVYAINVLLGYDKHIIETDMNKRIELLENYIKGEGGTVIDGGDIDNPYAADLRKQLANEARINSELSGEILSLKRKLADNRAIPADGNSVGVA
jgi:hypothetical protein